MVADEELLSAPFGAVAVGEFVGEYEGELSISPGDRLLITITEGLDGWWQATHLDKDRPGLVPATYVKRQELRPALVRADFVGEHELELSVVEGERVGVLDVNRDADGWTCVVRAADSGREPPFGPALVPADWLVKATLAVMVEDFEAEADVELRAAKDQQVWVLPRPIEGGWSEVLDLSGSHGLVPETYLAMQDELALPGLTAPVLAVAAAEGVAGVEEVGGVDGVEGANGAEPTKEVRAEEFDDELELHELSEDEEPGRGASSAAQQEGAAASALAAEKEAEVAARIRTETEEKDATEKAAREAEDSARREAAELAEAEARRVAEAGAEARRVAEAKAEAEARRVAGAQAEALRLAEAEAAARRVAETEAEARRVAEAQAEAKARRVAETEAAAAARRMEEAETEARENAQEEEWRRRVAEAETRKAAEADTEARSPVEAGAEATGVAETGATAQKAPEARRLAEAPTEEVPMREGEVEWQRETEGRQQLAAGGQEAEAMQEADLAQEKQVQTATLQEARRAAGRPAAAEVGPAAETRPEIRAKKAKPETETHRAATQRGGDGRTQQQGGSCGAATPGALTSRRGQQRSSATPASSRRGRRGATSPARRVAQSSKGVGAGRTTGGARSPSAGRTHGRVVLSSKAPVPVTASASARAASRQTDATPLLEGDAGPALANEVEPTAKGVQGEKSAETHSVGPLGNDSLPEQLRQPWRELSLEQRRSAMCIGYTAARWDALLLQSFMAADAEEEILQAAGQALASEAPRDAGARLHSAPAGLVGAQALVTLPEGSRANRAHLSQRGRGAPGPTGTAFGVARTTNGNAVLPTLKKAPTSARKAPSPRVRTSGTGGVGRQGASPPDSPTVTTRSPPKSVRGKAASASHIDCGDQTVIPAKAECKKSPYALPVIGRTSAAERPGSPGRRHNEKLIRRAVGSAGLSYTTRAM